MDKTFIVSQVFVEKEENKGYQNYISVGVTIRKIKAKNESEAIGKFILNTNDIIVKQKLTPECVEFKKLKEIK